MDRTTRDDSRDDRPGRNPGRHRTQPQPPQPVARMHRDEPRPPRSIAAGNVRHRVEEGPSADERPPRRKPLHGRGLRMTTADRRGGPGAGGRLARTPGGPPVSKQGILSYPHLDFFPPPGSTWFPGPLPHPEFHPLPSPRGWFLTAWTLGTYWHGSPPCLQQAAPFDTGVPRQSSQLLPV